jgi:hypothetical protein
VAAVGVFVSTRINAIEYTLPRKFQKFSTFRESDVSLPCSPES